MIVFSPQGPVLAFPGNRVQLRVLTGPSPSEVDGFIKIKCRSITAEPDGRVRRENGFGDHCEILSSYARVCVCSEGYKYILTSPQEKNKS